MDANGAIDAASAAFVMNDLLEFDIVLVLNFKSYMCNKSEKLFDVLNVFNLSD